MKCRPVLGDLPGHDLGVMPIARCTHGDPSATGGRQRVHGVLARLKSPFETFAQTGSVRQKLDPYWQPTGWTACGRNPLRG
jgi:hypothetical protein